MANKPTPETAKVVTADQVRIGDEIFVRERWSGQPPGMADRWRTVVDIEDAPSGSMSDFLLIPEVFHGEPGPHVQWVRVCTLVIVRK